MSFHADLHVHSKYSRATSRDADLEHMAHGACRKGIGVVSTGDFTHPAWLAELKQKLVPAEPGLFRLRPDIEREVMRTLPRACNTFVRFMLSVEISTIYKKGEKTRKIHHLLYAPDFEAADKIATRLGRIGNISSDGRPILGLDSRNLLEITLESHPASYLIPAHIWTPWFAVLGSKGGFDTIDDCYGDLTEHIFAVETGLSSDPHMNWRLSQLDRYRLVSNSDAHSPPKLGREATVFTCEPDYFAIRHALQTGEGYGGTVEFFPEEGKYHLDGHRKCGLRQTPRETLAHDCICPECGQPTTVGVLHRVELLADRAEDEVVPPATAGTVQNLVPLPEILSELVGTGPTSKAVERTYDRVIGSLGPELSILNTVPIDEIERAESELLAEAISRLRAGQVIRDSGYDGEYGVIRLFEPSELARRTSSAMLFDMPNGGAKADAKSKARTSKNVPEAAATKPAPTASQDTPGGKAREGILASPSPAAHGTGVLSRLDPDQRAAAETMGGALMILAGPGSGKTRTLTHRIASLIHDHDIAPASCLAITFTRRAASEMRERLALLLPERGSEVVIHTFHSLGLAMLREHPDAAGVREDFHVAGDAERVTALAERMDVPARKAESWLRAISKAKRVRSDDGLDEELAGAMHAYREMLAERGWVDFDDLVGHAVALLDNEAIAAEYRARFRAVSVDEFQDVDEQQYRLMTLLAPRGHDLCVIGDPKQAIYGFRGADATCFDKFARDYPEATVIQLAKNYRSSGTIVKASSQVIERGGVHKDGGEAVREMLERVTVHTAPTDKAEAEFVVHSIEKMIGGHSFFSIDSGRATPGGRDDLSFADFAVLYRTDAQADALCEAFARSGMPFKKHGHALLIDDPDVQALLQVLRETARTADAMGVGLVPRIQQAADAIAQANPAHDVITLDQARRHLLVLAESSGDEWERFTELVAGATPMDTWDPRADRVSLLTIHASKGLEFPVVFMTGLEDGILPLRFGGKTADAALLEEERRLCYVGMTRAKDRLVLSRAVQRSWRGKIETLPPSPYLWEIQQSLVRIEDAAASKPKRTPESQLTLL